MQRQNLYGTDQGWEYLGTHPLGKSYLVVSYLGTVLVRISRTVLYSTVRGGFGQELRQISPSVNFDFSGMYVRTMSLTPGFGRLNGYVRTTGISAAAGVR